MDYKLKLLAFNSTDKYKREVEFLKMLMPGCTTIWFNILDYGAGLCKTAFDCCAEAFDINNYKTHDVIAYHLNELPDKSFQYIYFMHSLAHIPNTVEVLKDLKQRYNATITVITPNASWLKIVGDTKSDPTVIKHYTQSELKELFVSCGYEVTLQGQFGEEKNGVNERIFLQAK